MTDSYLFIQVNSGDFSCSPSDTYYNFTNIIPIQVLDPKKDYEVCLYDILFQNDQSVHNPALFPLRSFFVNTNLVANTLVGNVANNSIFGIQWTQLVTGATPPNQSGADSGIFLTSYPSRQWLPLQIKNINNVTTYFTYQDDGSKVTPTAVSGFTSVTYAIREVI